MSSEDTSNRISLFIVPTPIGNLEDMTFRAIRVLKEADMILAEDTRTSGKLLKHFEISTPMQSHHMHNEHKDAENWVQAMEGGKVLAVISDAGTPAISDPGFLLVRAALEAGLEVQCLPGATAFVPALVSSGFPCDTFHFEGFLPVKKGRKTKWESLVAKGETIVLYESPHKIQKTLKEIAEYFGASQKVSISREISKKFEEHLRGEASDLLKRIEAQPIKGEMVVVISK